MRRTAFVLLVIITLFSSFITIGLGEESSLISSGNFLDYLKDPQKHEELYQAFTPQVRQQVSLEDLPALWQQITTLGGNLIGAQEATAQTQGDFTVSTLYLDMEKQDLVLSISFDGQGFIGGFFINLAPAKEPSQEELLPQGIIQVQVTFGQEPWLLPGTITLPSQEENIPAVVLVHGSGPNDKNETMGALTPFKDIAWALVQQGIASIRYDKRTLVYPNETAQTYGRNFTVQEEVIDDALAAAKAIKEYEGIDPDQVYLIGHSLGAMLGPRIAAANQREAGFAGLILLCGSPKSLVDIIISQSFFALKQAGDTLSQEKKNETQAWIEAEKEKYSQLKAQGSLITQENIFGQPATYFLEMDQHDPAEILKALQLPTLIVQGGEDFQVIAENGIEAWMEALGKQENITYQTYPSLNHGLVTYTGDQALQYTVREYNTPAQVDETLLGDIIHFIKQ